MHKQINQLRADLMAQFPERKDVIDGSLAAVLASEHVLLIGQPGTAVTTTPSQLAFDTSYPDPATAIALRKDIQAGVRRPELRAGRCLVPRGGPAASGDSAIRQAFGQQVGNKSAETNNAESGFYT